MKTKSFFLIALMSVFGLAQCFMTSCKPKEPTYPYSDYFGTWVDADYGETVTLTANKLVYLNDYDEGYTMEDLTWSPITNSAGIYQTLYPSGYIIRGKVTAKNGFAPPKSDKESDEAEIGDIAIDWWYISTGKGALMWGEWYSEYRQAAFGPYIKK